MMTKLEQLIKELCPNGVEYKKLGEVASISRGGSFQKKDFCEDGVPCIHYGQIYTRYGLFADKTLTFISEDATKKQKYAAKNDIVMAVTSENIDDVCKCVAWLGDDEIAVSGHTAIIHHTLNPKYLCYYFHTAMFYAQKKKLAHGTKVIEVTPDKLTDITIPVPPIEIQVEIVKILDEYSTSVTALQQELENELTARKKQYEYYRDLLLDFGVHGGTSEREWRTIRLGDICSIITKGTTPKSYEKTGIAFIKTEAFVGRYIDKSKLSFVSAETHNGFLKRSILQENDILFTIAGATIGKMAIVTADILPANTNQACAIIRLRNDNDLGYVKYILESVFMKIYMKQCIKGSAQPNLNLQQLNDFKFPYPITDKKIEIVSILDRFDKLCNDISEGLPAEIEARRKQYEYYRDKLLSFEERKNA